MTSPQETHPHAPQEGGIFQANGPTPSWGSIPREGDIAQGAHLHGRCIPQGAYLAGGAFKNFANKKATSKQGASLFSTNIEAVNCKKGTKVDSKGYP